MSTACEMLTQQPNIGPILLECSNLPPYAHAVQLATGRPVFDFTTMIDFYFKAATRSPFKGIY